MLCLGLTAAATNLAAPNPQTRSDVPHPDKEAPRVIQVQKGTAPVVLT